MNIILFEQFPEGQVISSSDFRAQHIRTVLRLGVGDSFSLGIINGPIGEAVITGITDEGISFSWAETSSADNAAALYPVTLLVAQVRPICMKRILREAVSLGVRKLLVTGADTAEKSYQVSGLWKHGEYEKYLLDGAMQAAKTGLSEIELVPCVDQAVKHLPDGSLKLMLDNIMEGVPLSQMEVPLQEVVLAVGPERGWSDRERALLVKAGFVPVSLGSRVLRTETACCGGISILLGRMQLI